MLHAAVIIPIVRYDEPAIVFVRRAAHLRRNPSQIGFPGGVIDPGDAGPQAAALREFEEELGIPRERVRVVDRLEDVVTLALSVTVTPFIGWIEPPLQIVLDTNETQSAHEVPLAALYEPGALHQGIEPVERDGVTYRVPSWLFNYESLHVWGATGRMLHGLLARYPSPDELAAYFLGP
jgi:8-oxo-dGTP pyrophosphatase MutT (NUDIX family)